jgi:hypothetical protein
MMHSGCAYGNLYLTMSRALSELVGASEPMFSIILRDLERASGHHGVDVQFTGEIIRKGRMKVKELGLDPADTTGPELYHGLINMLKLHEGFIAKRIGVEYPSDVDEVMTCIKYAIDRIQIPKNAWVLKHSVARKLLKAVPPKKVMKYLNYRSVDSMLKREPITEIYGAIRFLETQAWQDKFLAKYKSLKPSDFENRDIEIVRLDAEKWSKATNEYVLKNRHNITHLKELGVIVMMPMPVKYMQGVTLAVMPIVLHYLNEIRLYTTYLKMQQVRPDFGDIVTTTLIEDPHDHALISSKPIHWRVIQRYYGSKDADHPEVFEPHVLPEDLYWRGAEEILYKFEPALHFWHEMDYVGMMFPEGPVSFNLMDVAVSYVNNLPYEYRSVGRMRESLERELFVRYLGQPTLEHQVLRQLDNKMIEPGLLALSSKVKGKR